jgi:glycosyltransferase involved in cell wall biosynthesis
MRPQVIHAHYLRGLAWGLPWGRVHPTVVTPWGSDVLEEQGAFRDVYSRSLTRSVLTHADLVTVHSGYMEERVKPLVKARTPLVRIGWGVDLHRFRPGLPFSALAGRWKIEPWHKVIVSPRLAQPLYRHEVVIQAMPQVLARVPETILVLSEQFADPAYVSSLKTLADDLGVRAQVRFVGAIPYEDMPLWLNRAQAVVMIPTSDGMPNTLLETMACGGVPILSRLPQYRDAVTDGREGFLIDPQPHTLADVLIRVLGDEDLRARMGVINRDKACRIADQDREMAMMEVLYHRLAAASSWC